MSKLLWWLTKRISSFDWSVQLSVGNAILDSEHKNLIAKINHIMRLIEAKDSSALSDMLELLEIWLDTHFKNEEMIAQAIKFDFTQHGLEHQRLLIEFQDLKNKLATKNGAWTDSESKLYYLFFHDWLIGHITNEDMKMKPALQNQAYNFMPRVDSEGVGSIIKPKETPAIQYSCQDYRTEAN